MKKVAVIGSGISGLAAAWILSKKPQDFEVSLFESANYFGGHSNTIDVTIDGITHPVDTGFLVHNDRTYPHLIELFKALNIDTHPSEMSFSVKAIQDKLEWAGTNLNSLFIQRSNLVSPKFYRMIRDILRFNKEKSELLQWSKEKNVSLGDLLFHKDFSKEFRDWYLVPMGACIWSTPTSEMLKFPAATFIQFCENHGLLQITDRPQWKTVINGSRVYVEKMIEEIHYKYLNEPVVSVHRKSNLFEEGKVLIKTNTRELQFDEVIMATHTDVSLKILNGPKLLDREVLGGIEYQENIAYLHSDESFLPENKKAWAAWNYETNQSEPNHGGVMISYLINELQPLPFKKSVIVTLNPTRVPDENKTFKKIIYHHPVFGEKAPNAQKKLKQIQGVGGVWFAGAWTRYGFHEDGLLSGIQVANLLGAWAPWQK